MNHTQLDATRLASINKMSKTLKLFVWPGALGVLLSFFENSPFWSIFILLNAWIGVVMGLTGGPGFADYLLQKVPPHRQVSKGTATLLSLVTFWIPTLAMAAFTLPLARALREDLRPQSQLDDNFLVLMPQVFVMYFLAAGVSWTIVGREVKLVQQELDATQE